MNDRNNIMSSDSEKIVLKNFTFRLWKPRTSNRYQSIFLLHGLSGDENSMSIFTKNLPDTLYLVSVRGLFSFSSGGYSWIQENLLNWPKFKDFIPAVEQIIQLFYELRERYSLDNGFHLVGFSQGAALAYSILHLYPSLVASIASLSGFLPLDIDPKIAGSKLKEKHIYITHGSLDDIVPIEKAREARDYFLDQSANVYYCEDVTGHKLSINCFRGLRDFYSFIENN